MILLSQETGFLGPIAWVLGQIFNLLFQLVDKIGIPNIGLCIILFTIIVRLILLPLTIKQQKFSKLSSMLNPEVQAIQAKYKNKKDNESVMKMNEETKAVYAKYGTSPTGGCLTMLIQLPILFALYRVLYKIPGYVTPINDLLGGVADKIMKVDGYESVLKTVDISSTSKTGIIDSLYMLSNKEWSSLASNSGFSDISSVITSAGDKLDQYNNFFGISLTQNPGWTISWALLIPLLAGLTQWVSTKLMTASTPQQQSGNDMANSMANSMKVMNNIMPIMSIIFCVSFPAGVGLYWIMGSVVMIIQQLVINRYMSKIDIEQMVQKNIDKENEKRARKGLPPKKITNTATSYVESVKKQESLEARKGEIKTKAIDSSEYYKNSSAKPGSLAAKANMVKQFNEKNKKSE